MVALALPRRQKESGSGNTTPSSEMPPPLAAVHAASFSGRPSPELGHQQDAVTDAERIKPKRSSSFGRGLGQLASLTSGKPKTVDIMSFGRNKSGASTPQSPVPQAAGDNVAAAAAVLANSGAPLMGPPSTPDPSHLTHFSLLLSDLVNKAFVPCTAGSAPAANTTSVASNVAAAAKGATTPKINQITYEGKHLPDKAKIIEIAQTVVGELRYAEAVDAYLLRAVSRQILKALTLFAARVDSLLVSPTKDPGAVRIPTNAKEGLHLPAAMEFNLGLVTLMWIVEDSLERCIEGDRDAHGELIADENGAVHDGMPHFVSEILTPVRKRMEGTILHIIQPILAQTKQSIARCISSAVPTPFVSPVTLSPATTSVSATAVAGVTDSGAASPPLTAGIAAAGSGATPGHVSPPLRLAEAGPGSAWLRELDGRLEGARRLLLPRIEERCGQDGEGWFISVAIHVIWKGLLILTSRSVSLPSNAASELLTGSNAASTSAFDRLMGEVNQKRSPSPAQLAQALKAVGVGSARSKSRSNDPFGHASDSGRQSPSHHCTASGHSTIAPFSLVSARLCAHQLAELQTFEKLMLRFCDGFLRKPGTQSKKTGKDAKRSRFALFSSGASLSSANQPSIDLSAYDPDEEDELARAALAEAMHALRSTIIVLQSLEREPATICAGLEHLKSLDGAQDGADGASNTAASAVLGTEAAKALDAIPNLLLLQILYNRLPMGPGRLELPSPPALFGYTWTDYEKAIAGFAGGEQWAQAVALRYKPEIEKAWKATAARRDEKLAALERKTAAAAKAGMIGTTRSVSGSSARAGSILARGGSLHSEDEDDDEDDAPEAMSQSVPELKKPSNNEGGRSSDEQLGGGGGQGATGASRGRPSPGHSPRRSSTLAHPAMAEAADAAAPTAAAPRFWRRSTSNGRTGFHLSFSGLRAQSPRAETTTTPPSTTAHAADPLASAPASASASATALVTSPQPGVAEALPSPPRSSAGLPAADGEADERLRIQLEAKVEKRSLCVFAKALTYAGRGQVQIDLP
ncbi:uncharacterized protein UTRI_02831 [Ustilago trichophora]|uniref:Uncharacterized protein n=1 Tax=Ustilago trichophora TaxID=86804 RepID=A0A5C3ENQ2_9BASI|nr:uncharacterized protein UTRI_02831 [Ustilago trichophora]